MIDIRGLTKQYGRRSALQNVDFVVRPGITGLLGPNGSGKSTLIKA
ncbi:MAG: AAA family ATPase, partial [Pirellula sp.]